MQRTDKAYSLYAFYIFFGLFILNRLFFFSPGICEQTMSCITYPFLLVHNVIRQPFTASWHYTQSHADLQKELAAAQEENQQLKTRVIAYEAQRFFTQLTQEPVDFASQYVCEKKILANILMLNLSQQEDFCIINQGSLQGIEKNDIVVYKNMLIGRIVELYPWYSKVALISDRRCRISAQCHQADTVGIFVGKNNGQAQLQFIAHFKEVAPGDIILSTGSGMMYPQGFGLGEIKELTTDHVSHHIQVKLLLDFSQISYVYVVSKEVRMCNDAIQTNPSEQKNGTPED